MNPRELETLLQRVRDRELSPEQAAERLKLLPFEDLGFAKVDHHRALRRGFPEAVFGAGKTPEQIAAIVDRIAATGQNVLVTRTDGRGASTGGEPPRGRAVPRGRALSHAEHRAGRAAARARCRGLRRHLGRPGGRGGRCHRLSSTAPRWNGSTTWASPGFTVCWTARSEIREAKVVIVVAGMEGALPSVVGRAGRGAGDRGADQHRLRGRRSRGWRRCWPCSTRARRASPSSTSTTGSAPATWRR